MSELTKTTNEQQERRSISHRLGRRIGRSAMGRRMQARMEHNANLRERYGRKMRPAEKLAERHARAALKEAEAGEGVSPLVAKMEELFNTANEGQVESRTRQLHPGRDVEKHLSQGVHSLSCEISIDSVSAELIKEVQQPSRDRDGIPVTARIVREVQLEQDGKKGTRYVVGEPVYKLIVEQYKEGEFNYKGDRGVTLTVTTSPSGESSLRKGVSNPDKHANDVAVKPMYSSEADLLQLASTADIQPAA